MSTTDGKPASSDTVRNLESQSTECLRSPSGVVVYQPQLTGLHYTSSSGCSSCARGRCKSARGGVAFSSQGRFEIAILETLPGASLQAQLVAMELQIKQEFTRPLHRVSLHSHVLLQCCWSLRGADRGDCKLLAAVQKHTACT